MTYTTGDLLLFKASSGNYTSVLTDIITGNKTINFNFVECKDVDGNFYSTVTIGSQVWMAENLKTSKYRNNIAITDKTNLSTWGTSTTEALSDYATPTNSTTYGKLYNWYSASSSNNLAPLGWHIPTDADWTSLSDFLGGLNIAGDKLKENGNSHWATANTTATNETGFVALPGGTKSTDNTVYDIGNIGYWWTSSEGTTTNNAWYRSLSNQNGTATRGYFSKSGGMSVRCLMGDLPIVSTTSASSITASGFISGGGISFDGNFPIISSGVCWSTNQNPTINDSKTSDWNGTGTFTSTITGLTAQTTYYVRAYATNSFGTGYGTQLTVSTELPVISTSTVSTITATTATGGGSISLPSSAGPVTTRGICWSTNQNPTILDSKTSDGSGVGTFTSSITGLNTETVYYVRAYATNGAGTAYGTQVSFSTKLPVISTTAISAITATTATCGGNITDIGGSAVTSKGVCWSTSPAPTIALSTKTSNGTGFGTFASSITGLTIGTTYYVRAYATNNIGTTYGNEISFTTILPTVTTNDISNITATTASCGGNVTDIGGAAVIARGVCWSTSSSPTTSNSKTTNGTGIGTFTSSITGLTVGTTYYVRAYATNSIGTAYGNEFIFSTKLATVTTTNVSSLTASSVTTGGNITAIGGAAVTERGVCWSIISNPTISNSKTSDGSGIGSFTSQITGLSAETTYYIRAYATNSIGTAYGSQITISTALPAVTTTAISAITADAATGGGSITLATGAAAVKERGICWSTNQNPIIADSKTSTSSGAGTYSSAITGLNAETVYYVRAYATNSVGTAYGTQVSFSTKLPTLTTSAISAITATSATCGGNITDIGGSAVTAKGVCWSTSTAPTIELSTKTTNGTGSGTFSSSITGLTVGTTYYVRAYATNSIGTTYGNEISFSTVLPTVTTNDISNITATTAGCGGNVTDIGGAAVTARGVCWSTSSSPTISNSRTSNGMGIGAFTSSITGLTVGTTYYVRAYATNSIGTVYGHEISFSTKLATVTTTNESSLTATSVTTGGNVTAIGGTAVTERGVCWSTSSNPTISNSKTSDGSGIGAFISQITGLSPETTYYIRAYATNSIGTAYGSQITISTTLPVVTTTALSSITANSAICGGNISNSGGSEVTSRGICWSTQTAPTILNSKTSDGNGIGSFSSLISGLNINTLYYVRAYAVNSIGTSYGNEIVFSINKPSINTLQMTNITSTTAIGGSVIINSGGPSVTSRGVCWSTTPNPTTALSTKIISSNISDTLTSSISGLTAGTTYYLRAFATNLIGTSYGNEISFTTNGIVTDIDGNTYHYITIGTQTWMVENLKTTKYRDGTSIPLVTNASTWASLTSPAYSFYNNDATTYKNTYGALYNWYAVNTGKLAPIGWHVATDAEWVTLTTYLGGESTAGSKLKEDGNAHWSTANTDATNSSGFTALPGGFRQNSTGGDIGSWGWWWTSTLLSSTQAKIRIMYSSSGQVNNNSSGYSYGHSVRCVKD